MLIGDKLINLLKANKETSAESVNCLINRDGFIAILCLWVLISTLKRRMMFAQWGGGYALVVWELRYDGVCFGIILRVSCRAISIHASVCAADAKVYDVLV